MPRNPKAGKPLGKREAELARALPGSSSIAEAGRKVGMNRDAAHDAYEALKVKVPELAAKMGINRARVLQRFDVWADGATKEVLGKFGEKVKLEATDLRIKSNAHLGKLLGMGPAKEDKGNTPPTQINIQVNKASDDDIRRVLELAARVSENGADVQSGVVQA